MSHRPDRPLVVKCTFDKSHKKITFSSSQNCSYDTLRKKIQQCFSLSAATYAVSWKDDDGEITNILTEDDLTEAICYFCSGDDAPSSSAASILSGRSFGRGGKVTLRVSITVDYDGPSLSDTSSLASLDEYRSRNGSRRSLSFGSPSIELDDDSITVSSRDQMGPASSVISEERDPHFQDEYTKPSPTIKYPQPKSDSRVTFSGEGSELSFSLNGGEESSLSGTDIETEELSEALEKYPADPSAVFERLKIQEALGDEEDWESASEEDRGARWLRDQNARAIRTTMGVVAKSSMSDDDFEVKSLSLERNTNGGYYYIWNASNDQSQGPDDHDIREDDFPPARVEMPRPTSMHLNWVAAQQHEAEEHRRLQASASQISLRPHNWDTPKRTHSDDDIPIVDHGFKYYNLPSPPSDILTACSHCNTLLESIRYVCSTCGENEPLSQQQAKQNEQLDPFSYPPRSPHNSPTSSSSSPSQTYFGSTESLFSIHSRKVKSFLENPPFASSASSSRTRVDTVLHETSSGFELCVGCFETDGILHSIETGLGSPSSGHSAFGQSSTSLQIQDPNWRTSAPKKGHARHAFYEKYWGEFGWENICDDECSVSVCSICSVNTERQRYKCAACPKFYLCRGCYGVVHLVHPTHAFILVPDKQRFPQIDIKDLTNGQFDIDDEPSMEHRVTCAHCLMPIVGALFHCAICDSVDICSNCEAAGLPGNLELAEGGHNSSHILLKIPYVMEHDKLQSASRAAMYLWRGRDSGVAITASHAISQSDGAYAQTVVGGNSMQNSPEMGEDHKITCDNCSQSITGIRYQCAHCPSYPSAYNLCSRCEARSWAVHDPMHIFFKLPHPVRRAIESRGAFLPPLYQIPAGPPPGRPRSGDPRQYLKDLVHTIVLCDRCMNHIEGEWFRCACCSIDLCDACEAVDTHAENHHFVVFKSVVELKAFKAWTNPENPTPILDTPVYD